MERGRISQDVSLTGVSGCQGEAEEMGVSRAECVCIVRYQDDIKVGESSSIYPPFSALPRLWTYHQTCQNSSLSIFPLARRNKRHRVSVQSSIRWQRSFIVSSVGQQPSAHGDKRSINDRCVSQFSFVFVSTDLPDVWSNAVQRIHVRRCLANCVW